MSEAAKKGRWTNVLGVASCNKALAGGVELDVADRLAVRILPAVETATTPKQ
jgi:hypothetical protein